jgi:FHS family L-fucose permease-like MFS transporter
VTGHVDDLTGSVAMAFVLPAPCYAVIAAFGLYAIRPVRH